MPCGISTGMTLRAASSKPVITCCPSTTADCIRSSSSSNKLAKQPTVKSVEYNASVFSTDQLYTHSRKLFKHPLNTDESTRPVCQQKYSDPCRSDSTDIYISKKN